MEMTSAMLLAISTVFFDDLCDKSVSLGDFRAYIFMQKWCLGVTNRNFLINKG